MSREKQVLLVLGVVALALVSGVVAAVLTVRLTAVPQAPSTPALVPDSEDLYNTMPMMDPEVTPGPWGAYPGPWGGMMGGGPWAGGMMGPGMMGGGPWGFGNMMGFYNPDVEPLTLEEAQEILENYLASLGKPNLAVREIMVFDNHVYAQIVEKDTGMGAWEVLIDPVTRTVTFEHGPTMMWNLKYSPMAGWMMGWAAPQDQLPEVQVSPEEAVEIAQAYLDRALPGTIAEEPVPFYGYYTLHILKDGQVIGMLSVNAYTGAVFPHFWHGRFLGMVETELHTE